MAHAQVHLLVAGVRALHLCKWNFVCEQRVLVLVCEVPSACAGGSASMRTLHSCEGSVTCKHLPISPTGSREPSFEQAAARELGIPGLDGMSSFLQHLPRGL